MKPPPFEYHAPTTIADALALSSNSDDARFLAGGQSLMPMLNMRVATPQRIIDLNRIDGLSGVSDVDGEIRIGAMTRQRRLERDADLREKLPLIAMALRHVGHLQTRNRGSIGGSLCHLDPSAELPAVALAYDASLDVTGPAGARSIAMRDWATSMMETSLSPGELLTGLRFRRWSANARCGFQEFARRHGDFAIAGAAALLDFDGSGRMSRVSLTLFGVDFAPVRVTAAESMLMRERASPALFAQAAAHCAPLAKLTDPYYSAAYRGEVATAMAERALAQAAGFASETDS